MDTNIYTPDVDGSYRNLLDYSEGNVNDDGLAEIADELLSQKRFGDGWHYSDETIGETRGIILTFSDYGQDAFEVALNETNLAFAKDHMASNGEEGIDFDFGYISGFGGAYALTVKVYEDACVMDNGLMGEHAWRWSDEDHGYEDVPGFDESPVYRCADCGAAYLDEPYEGGRVYTKAFLAAVDMRRALEEYPILDESAHSDRQLELLDEDMTHEINRWKSDQDDLTDEQAEQVVEVFRDLDYLPEGIDPDGWDHVMVTEYVITEMDYVCDENLYRVLDWCKEAWYIKRGQEILTAQLEGQMTMEVV